MAYAAFLLIAIGRIQELVPGLGSLPLGKVAMAIALPLLIIKWKRLPRLSQSVAPFFRAARALVILAVVLAPFSIWPGETLQFLTLQLPVLAAAVIICCKISYQWNVLRRIIRILVVAGVALAVTALVSFHGGRATNSSSYDANDLAYVLVSTVPLALAFALTAKTKLSRLFNAGACLVLVIVTLLTSSRGGLFGLVAILAVLALIPLRRPQDGKSRNRIVLPVLGLVCAFMLVWSYLPSETRDRLSTVLNLGSDYNLDTSDRTGRSAIWQRSFAAVLERPIGYGADVFPMVDLRAGGTFKAAHNSYLQVLVELGFLGLLFFVRMYVLCWRELQKVRKRLLAAASSEEHDQLLVFARMLQVALVGNAVSGFFLSMAYTALLWVLFAVVIACVSIVVPSSGPIKPGLPR